MEEKKEFYLIVEGKKVIVSEELYREYVRPVRKDQRQRRRNKRCKIVGKKGNLVRCQKDCSECRYAQNGNPPNSSILSLDEFRDTGYEMENWELDVEANYIAAETDRERKEKLHNAIRQLTPRQQEIVRLIFFEGKTKTEVAKLYGVDKSAISHSLNRIFAMLKKYLGKN